MIDYTEMDYTEMELQRIEFRIAQHEDVTWLINLYRNATGHDRVLFGEQIEEELYQLDRIEPDINGNRHYTHSVDNIDYVIWNDTQVLLNGVMVGRFVNGTILFDAVATG
jgi:hypothetical protein